MTNDHFVARFSDPLNRVTITKGCYSAKANNKRWLSENETYCSTRSVLRGNIFLNITTLISPFVYNPNKQRGGYYSSPNIITNCVRTLSASIKQMKWNFCIAVHFFVIVCFPFLSGRDWNINKLALPFSSLAPWSPLHVAINQVVNEWGMKNTTTVQYRLENSKV